VDSDIVLSAIALSLSLIAFLGMSLVEASVLSVGRERLFQLVSEAIRGASTLDDLSRLPMGPTGAVSVLKVVALAGGIVSGAALVMIQGNIGWGYVAGMSAGFLVFIGLVRSYSAIFAHVYGEKVALATSSGVRALSWLAYPVTWSQARLIVAGLRARGARQGDPLESAHGPFELGINGDGEPLDEHERQMIRGVLELDKTVAREIMVPRVDLIAVEAGITVSELAEKMVECGHSRIPVYKETIDHIEGVAHSRDVLLQLAREGGGATIVGESMTRPPLFIPESKTLEELLGEFQERRIQLAIVVDEYGGVSGLVTIEDLLEEIVGEIADEFEVDEPEVVSVGENDFMVDARVSVDQLARLLSVSIEGDGFDTLGGFVFERLGKIPSAGDTIEYDGLRIEVISTVGRRLKRLRVTRIEGTRPSE